MPMRLFSFSEFQEIPLECISLTRLLMILPEQVCEWLHSTELTLTTGAPLKYQQHQFSYK